MTTLVEPTFWNPVELFVFMSSFHNHLKLFWCGVYFKQKASFASICFRYTEMTNELITPIIWEVILVANIARGELTSLKCKWTRKWKEKGVD